MLSQIARGMMVMKIDIESIDGTVVSLTEARKRRAGLTAFAGPECLHRRITLDPQTKDADCDECKKSVNLSAWIVDQMHIWDRMKHDTDLYIAAKKDLDDERAAFSRQQRVKCQHCNKFTKKWIEREHPSKSLTIAGAKQ
jgi:hypothetical protein